MDTSLENWLLRKRSGSIPILSAMKCDICNHECFNHGTLKCVCDYANECADRVLTERWFKVFDGEDPKNLPSGVEWLTREVLKRLKGRCNPVIVVKHCKWYYENYGKNGV